MRGRAIYVIWRQSIVPPAPLRAGGFLTQMQSLKKLWAFQSPPPERGVSCGRPPALIVAGNNAPPGGGGTKPASFYTQRPIGTRWWKTGAGTNTTPACFDTPVANRVTLGGRLWRAHGGRHFWPAFSAGSFAPAFFAKDGPTDGPKTHKGSTEKSASVSPLNQFGARLGNMIHRVGRSAAQQTTKQAGPGLIRGLLWGAMGSSGGSGVSWLVKLNGR